MKKLYIVALIFFALTTFQSRACEICGCGHSDFQIGLLPNFNKGFAGLRYSTSRFNSRVRDEPSEFSRDHYQAMELWGGYNYKKFQAMVFVPYLISEKKTDDGITNTQGLGDVMLLLNYRLSGVTSLTKNEKTTVRHELFVGGGIKLPTGVNEVNIADPEFNVGDFNSQSGTGSVDYILNATYNFMWNNSGVVTNVAYRINTANQQDYRFGNRTYVNTAYYYTFTKSKSKIIPNAGINYQNNAVNRFDGVGVEDSKGYNLNATAGVNVLCGKIGINAITFIPISQNIYDGQTKLNSRFSIGLTCSL